MDRRPRISVYDIALTAMAAAVLEAAKLSLSFLMNIELVSLLIIVYTLYLGRRTLYAILVFVLLEGLLYGFGAWTVMYLYIWPLLSLLVWLSRRRGSVFYFSTLSGLFGLFFGALCSIPYFFIGGVSLGVSYWINGIPADLTHCVSNFVLCLFLFKPLCGVFKHNIIRR